MSRWFFIIVLLVAFPAIADDIYQSPEDFVSEAFAAAPPASEVLWLDKSWSEEIAEILDHPATIIRTRYWKKNKRTAWILEEIGKYKPITAGIIIDDNKIAEMRVLIYRESIGWEVRHPFFTDQFKDAAMPDGIKMDKRIDGISGATLSVNALTRMARLALYLHGKVMK